MEIDTVVEHRLPRLAPKGVAGFSNSECCIIVEVGSRGDRSKSGVPYGNDRT